MRVFDAFWRKLTQTKALENCNSELERAFFESSHRVTYLIGLSTADEGLQYKMYSKVVKFSVLLLVCGELWYTLTVASSLDEIVGLLNCLVLYFISFYRYKKMLIHIRDYNKICTDRLSPYLDITTNKRKKIVEYWANTNNRYLKLILGLGNLTLSAWFLYPLVDNIEYNLIVYVWLPFNYSSTCSYIFTYIVVGVVFFYLSHCVMVNDINLQAYLLHLICQFNVLADCFENVFDDCNSGIKGLQLFRQNSLKFDKEVEEKCKKQLGVLIEQHKTILKLVLKLRSTLSGPMLGQLVGSGTLICFIGYQATTTIGESTNLTKGLMSFFFLGFNLVEFYVICRWCEEITTQSHNIGLAAYCCGWESGLSVVPTIRSSLIMVIARANKPLILTAGGMYNLSLLSYTSLVKTSYSALTVLLRTKQN